VLLSMLISKFNLCASSSIARSEGFPACEIGIFFKYDGELWVYCMG
jgi:hypothetical protein